VTRRLHYTSHRGYALVSVAWGRVPFPLQLWRLSGTCSRRVWAPGVPSPFVLFRHLPPFDLQPPPPSLLPLRSRAHPHSCSVLGSQWWPGIPFGAGADSGGMCRAWIGGCPRWSGPCSALGGVMGRVPGPVTTDGVREHALPVHVHPTAGNLGQAGGGKTKAVPAAGRWGRPCSSFLPGFHCVSTSVCSRTACRGRSGGLGSLLTAVSLSFVAANAVRARKGVGDSGRVLLGVLACSTCAFVGLFLDTLPLPRLDSYPSRLPLCSETRLHLQPVLGHSGGVGLELG
jgi:hypothetical protein